MNKNISEKKKLVLLIVIAIVVVASFYLIFKNNIIAMQKGVDVKYINDPLYCEQDSDCFSSWSKTCGGISNIYQGGGSVSCKLAQCGPITCKNKQCTLDCNGDESK